MPLSSVWRAGYLGNRKKRETCQIFGPGTRKTAVVLSDGGPFLDSLDVWDQGVLRHPGSLIWSTMERFCSSEMPAE